VIEGGNSEPMGEINLDNLSKTMRKGLSVIRRRQNPDVWPFNSVARDEAHTQKYYYPPQKYPGPGHYRPDISKVVQKYLEVKFHSGDPHVAREKIERKPKCVIAEL
jgi:hypothetical protein